MAHPPVIIVDENDREIGLAMLPHAWKKGLYHRLVLVVIEDGKGNILLQKRSSDMVVFPGYWDNAAGGHVDEGMTYERAAHQEVSEELGITAPYLEEIGYFFASHQYEDKQMNHFHKVYRFTLDAQTIQHAPGEVSEVQWFSVAGLKAQAEKQPHLYTDDLHHVLERYY